MWNIEYLLSDTNRVPNFKTIVCTNAGSQAAVKKVMLKQFDNGTYRMTVEFSASQLQLFNTALTRNNMEWLRKIATFSHTGMEIMADNVPIVLQFIHSIKLFERGVQEIEHAVSRYFDIRDLSLGPIPSWVRANTGDSQSQDRDLSISYKSTDIRAKINEIVLQGIETGFVSIQVSLGLNNRAREQINSRLRNAGYTPTLGNDKVTLRVDVRSDGWWEAFDRVIAILSDNTEISPGVKDNILADVANLQYVLMLNQRPGRRNALDQERAANWIELLSAIYYLNEQANNGAMLPQPANNPNVIPNPPKGENADKLAGINFQGEIPEEFCCLLSSEIMTDPVYDPRCSQYKFEKSWITHWLLKNSTHPCTRDGLTSSGLRSDSELKGRINEFVAQQLQPSRPGRPSENVTTASCPAPSASKINYNFYLKCFAALVAVSGVALMLTLYSPLVLVGLGVTGAGVALFGLFAACCSKPKRDVPQETHQLAPA